MDNSLTVNYNQSPWSTARRAQQRLSIITIIKSGHTYPCIGYSISLCHFFMVFISYISSKQEESIEPGTIGIGRQVKRLYGFKYCNVDNCHCGLVPEERMHEFLRKSVRHRTLFWLCFYWLVGADKSASNHTVAQPFKIHCEEKSMHDCGDLCQLLSPISYRLKEYISRWSW